MPIDRHAVLCLSVLVAVCPALLPSSAQEAADRGTTTERSTILQPLPGGGVIGVQRERTEPIREREPRPDVPPDVRPRKARVAVMPAVLRRDMRARFQRDLQEQFGFVDPNDLESTGYTLNLVDALVNSRKVDVLERENLHAAVKEIDFGESDYADMSKVVRIGQMLNADYVVLPEIRYIRILGLTRNVPYAGRQQRQFRGKIATCVRTVDVKTSRIVSSSIHEAGITNRVRNLAESPALPVRDFLESLYRQSALQEASRIIDTAYPIKILAIGDGTVVINRGEGAIQMGEVLNVYSPGDVMIDPDTGENLGYHEGHVGIIRVIKIDQKTATAEVVRGEGQISKLNVCRRDAKPLPPPPQPPAARLD